MKNDLEQRLRDAAPPYSPNPRHRRHLRSTLRAELEFPPRRRVSPFLVGLLAALGFLSLASGVTELVSDSLEVEPAGTSVTGHQIWKPVVGQGAYGGDDAGDTPAEQQQFWEAIRQHTAAGEREIVGASAWTVQGKTLFMAEYLQTPGGESVITGSNPGLPPSEASPKHLPFLIEKGDAFLKMIEEGQAEYRGAEDIMVDGVPFRFEKWATYFPGFGDVIYWSGTLRR